MPKITLEYNDDERNDAIRAMRSSEMSSALWELYQYLRELRKGYIKNEIIVNDGKVLDEETVNKQFKQYSYPKELLKQTGEEIDTSLPNFEDNVSYIPRESVINKLEEILYEINDILDL